LTGFILFGFKSLTEATLTNDIPHSTSKLRNFKSVER
jgi:hypothetical protein